MGIKPQYHSTIWFSAAPTGCNLVRGLRVDRIGPKTDPQSWSENEDRTVDWAESQWKSRSESDFVPVKRL